LTTTASRSRLKKPMATKQANRDPTERMIAVLERIETELRGVKAEAKETNQSLGRVEAEAKETNQRLGRVEARLEGLETQAKRTNKRLGALEKRVTSVEVPAMVALEERVERLEAAVFKSAAE
jgi:predicted  nucleic acid-binding Zn-ribbon protein